MFIDLFLMLVSVLLGVIHLVLFAVTSAFGFVIPDAIPAAWVTVFSYIGLMQGIFPVDTAVESMNYLLAVLLVVYFVKLVLYFWNKIRGVQQPGDSDMPGA